MILHAQPLEPSSFARYGCVIAARGQEARTINGGSSLRLDFPGAVQMLGPQAHPGIALFRAKAQGIAGPWRLMERHVLGSQTFVPLRGARSLLLVALGDSAPDPDTLCAWLSDGSAAYSLHPGTWHHGLIALDDGDFAVFEREACPVDCEQWELRDPVWISSQQRPPAGLSPQGAA